MTKKKCLLLSLFLILLSFNLHNNVTMTTIGTISYSRYQGNKSSLQKLSSTQKNNYHYILSFFLLAHTHSLLFHCFFLSFLSSIFLLIFSLFFHSSVFSTLLLFLSLSLRSLLVFAILFLSFIVSLWFNQIFSCSLTLLSLTLTLLMILCFLLFIVLLFSFSFLLFPPLFFLSLTPK